MRSEQIPKLTIQKMQEVSYTHLDPMLHPDNKSLKETK